MYSVRPRSCRSPAWHIFNRPHSDMDINIPAVLEEVQAVSERYEQALVSNDVKVLRLTREGSAAEGGDWRSRRPRVTGMPAFVVRTGKTGTSLIIFGGSPSKVEWDGRAGRGNTGTRNREEPEHTNGARTNLAYELTKRYLCVHH